MERDDVLIAFKGSITSELLTSILQIMETKMEDLHEAPAVGSGTVGGKSC